MIPERDDFWLSTSPTEQQQQQHQQQQQQHHHHQPPQASSRTTAAASGANQLLLWRAEDNNSTGAQCEPEADPSTLLRHQRQTAWSRYLGYVEGMQSRGQKFDKKLALEAMFRGGDLVYSATAATVECAL